ncbi:ABC transporter substrate-binding protein [Algibacter amylolyticus]|uniref:ABC transporter substrate-binding protein n=1 Tax=Algibacter amylolyticus TaxID=1608400 RepID=A0A5M7B7H5_9FLAO|nr:helical backbone metal receptor [Algibacter amylolyticus]KAA5823375.1 ABC transporter substrate-binding protein [Algibacter amylolyticus]MBB5267522.1 ABC-type Fe3+-hydroxamate transport system substrate-binding protein [Algibacter amylolyticus]TSJ73863.1 ABC transporter substrate-binding protein [Algibacter amylolyticus]
MELVDQINRTIYFKDTPKRIISLVPSQTELLCDLGLEPFLVGVTKFCVHPHHIKTNVAVVGGTKQIQIEKIKALKPDIILCNKEENTKAIVEACQLICNVHVSDIFNVEDSVALIQQYGSIFNKKEEALSISNKIEREMESFNVFIQNKPVLKTVYFIWKNPWMVAANNTFIAYLLKINHFENVFASKIRYPEIDILDPASNENVDLVLLSSEPFPFKETHKKELQENYPNAKIVLVDGEMFSWYGSRLTKAFTYFKSLRLSLQNTVL